MFAAILDIPIQSMAISKFNPTQVGDDGVGGGGVDKKSPSLSSFSPVTSRNVGISPKTFGLLVLTLVLPD